MNYWPIALQAMTTKQLAFFHFNKDFPQFELAEMVKYETQYRV